MFELYFYSKCSLVVGDWRDMPLLLARRVARLLARAAMRAALARFMDRGLALSTWAKRTGVSVRTGTGSGGGLGGGTGSSGGTGDEAAVAVATVAATPVVGVAWGEHLSPASIFSTLRLALLARSRLLLPELACVAVAVAAAAVQNQRETSSPLLSVFNTNLAGIPSSLQRTHALYCEKAHGGGRGVEPVLV